jgi:hypothetical protein
MVDAAYRAGVLGVLRRAAELVLPHARVRERASMRHDRVGMGARGGALARPR